MKTKKFSDLITKDSHKINKNQKKGFLTGVMYLSPANESDHQMCFDHTDGCETLCLGCTSGKMRFDSAKNARINRTDLFFDDREYFLELMDKELASIQRRAEKNGFTPSFRPNGCSDWPWENDAAHLMQKYSFPWYDYTKSFTRMKRYLDGKLPSNYHLLFSMSEDEQNQKDCVKVLKRGGNVAVVFWPHVPDTFKISGSSKSYKVNDGDVDDLRWLDEPSTIVGLIAKGWEARKDTSGFIQQMA